MFLFCTGLVLLPVILAHDDAHGDQQMRCDFLAKQVEMLKQALDSLTCAADSDMNSVCDEIGKAIPSCMARKGSSHAAQDACMEDIAARKYGSLSGHEVLDCCKVKKYTSFLKLFKEAHSTACPVKAATARSRRSLYTHPGFGLNTIWFQYHLCHDIGLNCWFFTQGWGQKQFGDYYLYENVLGKDGLDLNLDLDDDFLALALIGGGLGGGLGGGGHYGSVGYPSRYRRSAEEQDHFDEDESADDDEDFDYPEEGNSRRRRNDGDEEDDKVRRRRNANDDEDYDYDYEDVKSRRRRNIDEDEDNDYDNDYDDEDVNSRRRRNDECKLRLDGYCVDEIPPEARQGKMFKKWFHGIVTSLGIKTLPALPAIHALPNMISKAITMHAPTGSTRPTPTTPAPGLKIDFSVNKNFPTTSRTTRRTTPRTTPTTTPSKPTPTTTTPAPGLSIDFMLNTN